MDRGMKMNAFSLTLLQEHLQFVHRDVEALSQSAQWEPLAGRSRRKEGVDE